MMYVNTNPLTVQISDAEQLLNELRRTADLLSDAIGMQAVKYARLRSIEQAYTDAENEEVASAIVQAIAEKSGPLAGIAATSKAYDIALNALRARLRNDMLADMAADLDDARREYDDAQAEQRQAETEFSAARHAADLRAAMLKAASI